MNDETIYSNLFDNLHYRYQYYNLRVLEAQANRERSREAMYKDKLEVIESLFRDIHNDGIICDYYPPEIEKLMKKFSNKEDK